jgi:hypothetical protein
MFAPPVAAPPMAGSPMGAPSQGQPGPVPAAVSHPAAADPFSPWGQSTRPGVPQRVDLDLEIMPPVRKRPPVLWIAAGAVVLLVGALFALASTSGGGVKERPALVPTSSSTSVGMGPADTRSTSFGAQPESDSPASSATVPGDRTDLLAPPSSAQQAQPKRKKPRGFTDAFSKQLGGRRR